MTSRPTLRLVGGITAFSLALLILAHRATRASAPEIGGKHASSLPTKEILPGVGLGTPPGPAREALEKAGIVYSDFEGDDGREIITAWNTGRVIAGVDPPRSTELTFLSHRLAIATMNWENVPPPTNPAGQTPVSSNGDPIPTRLTNAISRDAGKPFLTQGRFTVWTSGPKEYILLASGPAGDSAHAVLFHSTDATLREVWSKNLLPLLAVEGPLIELRKPVEQSQLYPPEVRFGQTVNDVRKHLTAHGMISSYAEQVKEREADSAGNPAEVLRRALSGGQPRTVQIGSLGATVLLESAGGARLPLRFIDYQFMDGLLEGVRLTTRYPTDVLMRKEYRARLESGRALFGEPEPGQDTWIGGSAIWKLPGGQRVTIKTTRLESGVVLAASPQNGIFTYPGEEYNDQAAIAFAVFRHTIQTRASGGGSK